MGTNDGPTTQTRQDARTRYLNRYPAFSRASRKLRLAQRRRRVETPPTGVSQVLPGIWVVMDPRTITRRPGMTLMRGSNRSR